MTPRQRRQEELARLRPLAIPPAQYALRFSVVVGPTGRVRHQGRDYSVHPEAIGFPGTLYLYPDRVRIVAGRYDAWHERRSVAGPSILPEHRAALLAQVSGERGRLYLKRQSVLELGKDAERLLTEIVHCHPRTWKGEVEILFDLLQQFGESALREALQQAVARHLFGAAYVKDLLLGRAAG